MDLSIIIVNWNSVGFLKKCLATVVAETSGVEYEILVIDSGSFDGCGEMLRRDYPQVRFIQSPENLGFARANNVAFRASRGRTLLFLNPDTEVVGPAIATMYRRLQTLPDAGSLGCRLLNADRSIQTSCIQSFPTIANQALDAEWLRARWPAWRLWGIAPLYEDGAEAKAVDAIAGACVMLRREVFERVGLFSEDYFMYAEDIDLSYKLRQAGYANYYLPEAVVIHYGGGSSQEAPSNFSVVMMRESIWRFLTKTRGRGYAWLYRLAMLLCALARLAVLAADRRLAGRREGGAGSAAGAAGKWQAVLRWSLSRQALLKQYG